jgi:putative tryptophan/tyrosine transport system substrate-binding protein
MASYIGRRKFLATLLGGTAAWPLAARAQQALPVIGFLHTESADRSQDRLRGFHQGLGETGYVEGRNITIEYRWAEDHNDRFPALAADLVRRQVAVIVANAAAAPAAKAATSRIPIVFVSGIDPVALGLVSSLNRPGGNLTGVSQMNVQLGPKRVQLLHEAMPAATGIALLVNPTFVSAETLSREAQAAAHNLGLSLHVLYASTDRELDAAFANPAELRTGGLVIGPDSFFTSRIEQLAALTLRHAVPALYEFSQFATAGGLMSYGPSLSDTYRLLGIYVGRVLKGAKPTDLPVEQASKYQLVINLKTAKALGLEIPPSLLARADEVIE